MLFFCLRRAELASLSLLVVSLAGCPRESLDPELDAGTLEPVGVNGDLSGVDPKTDTDGDGVPDVEEGTGDKDGDGIPAYRDADEVRGGGGSGGSSGGSTPDSGGTGDKQPDCSDADGDDICDDVDNCPDEANRAQHDGNGNGVGDACEAACDESASDKQQLGSGNVEKVEINGEGANVASVAAGSDVFVSFQWGSEPCLTPTNAQWFVFGFDDGSSPVCGVKGDCAPHPLTCAIPAGGCTDTELSDSVTLKAPSAPGTYKLLVDYAQVDSCDGWPSGAPNNVVGAVCVR